METTKDRQQKIKERLDQQNKEKEKKKQLFLLIKEFIELENEINTKIFIKIKETSDIRLKIMHKKIEELLGKF